MTVRVTVGVGELGVRVRSVSQMSGRANFLHCAGRCGTPMSLSWRTRRLTEHGYTPRCFALVRGMAPPTQPASNGVARPPSDYRGIAL